jgi:glutamate dehydrogenase (NAD(P)+)
VLVGAVDIHGGRVDPNGMDTDALLKIKSSGGKVLDYPGGREIGRDDIIDVECDIWVPAARPDVITMENVDRLKTKIVAEGANIPASPEAEAALEARGILILPDFIANAGGVICGAVEYQGSGEYQALTTITEKITYNTRHILEARNAEGITSREAALRFAQSRVKRAMGYRKTH